MSLLEINLISVQLYLLWHDYSSTNVHIKFPRYTKTINLNLGDICFTHHSNFIITCTGMTNIAYNTTMMTIKPRMCKIDTACICHPQQCAMRFP